MYGDRRRLRPAGRVDCVVFLRRRRVASMGSALAGGARSGRSDCDVRLLDAHRGPTLSVANDWTTVVGALVLSQITAIHGARYRQKLAEQLAALARNHRLLVREMDLRAEIASARERDHARLQASEAMLRKVFEASPDNIVDQQPGRRTFHCRQRHLPGRWLHARRCDGEQRDRTCDVARGRADEPVSREHSENRPGQEHGDRAAPQGREPRDESHLGLGCGSEWRAVRDFDGQGHHRDKAASRPACAPATPHCARSSTRRSTLSW